MKKIYSWLLLSCFLFSCGQKNKNTNHKAQTMEKVFTSLKDSLPQYPKEQQTSYVVHLNAKTPFELYLDYILISRSISNNFNKTVELNSYLLENGTHKIKIRF